MSVRHLVGKSILLALSFVLAPAALAAATFPSKPIQVIIPTKPGGGTDITGRTLAEEAGKILGQKVVIVNQAGEQEGASASRSSCRPSRTATRSATCGTLRSRFSRTP